MISRGLFNRFRTKNPAALELSHPAATAPFIATFHLDSTGSLMPRNLEVRSGFIFIQTIRGKIDADSIIPMEMVSGVRAEGYTVVVNVGSQDRRFTLTTATSPDVTDYAALDRAKHAASVIRDSAGRHHTGELAPASSAYQGGVGPGIVDPATLWRCGLGHVNHPARQTCGICAALPGAMPQGDITRWREGRSAGLPFAASLPADFRPGVGVLVTPELLATYAYGYANSGDSTMGALFYACAIDHLHTEYIFGRMTGRKPSPADGAIVDGYVAAVVVSRRTDPSTTVQQVRRVTWLLRQMAAEAARQGESPAEFHNGLERLAAFCPDIDVSDIGGWYIK